MAGPRPRRADGHGVRTDPAKVATERAAIEYLADLGLDVVPRLLAADVEANLLVLEDLHPAGTLSDDVTPEGLRAFARAPGVLHRAGSRGEDDPWQGHRAIGAGRPRSGPAPVPDGIAGARAYCSAAGNRRAQ